MKEKKITQKNYLIFAFICFVSILFVWYCASWYCTTKEYRVESSSITEMIPEVKKEELTNYILDNGNIMVYVTSLKENQNETFEKKLKGIIIDHELNDAIVVLDKDKITDANFFQNLSDQFLSDQLKAKKVTIDQAPNLYVFENGKIIDVYNITSQGASSDQLEQFILGHQVETE